MWKINMVVIIGMSWGLFIACLVTAMKADVRKKAAKGDDPE